MPDALKTGPTAALHLGQVGGVGSISRPSVSSADTFFTINRANFCGMRRLSVFPFFFFFSFFSFTYPCCITTRTYLYMNYLNFILGFWGQQLA